MSDDLSQRGVVVIGAGAAGIAAARSLVDAGIDALLVEARDRVGGRAHTLKVGGSRPLDLGCEWLHSADRNIMVSLAEGLGFTLDRREPPWRRRHPQRGFSDADHDAFSREQEAFYKRLENAAIEARRSGRDRRASDFLDPLARWNGLSDAISTYYNGAPWQRISALDFDAYVDTEINWRVEEGYGSLVATAGAKLPISLNCAVSAVETSRRAIRVVTSRGDIEAAAVIVTVPTSVLAAGTIRFDSAFDDLIAAAAGLPLGVADKFYFTLQGVDDLAPGTRLIGNPSHRDTGTYTIHPHGLALVEGYFGGDYARSLEAGGINAFADAARREIGWVLGSSISSTLRPIVATSWARDPHSLGSYSHALPDQSGSRAILAAPVDDRVLFAGEATSPHFFSTAHGAFEEGLRAAAVLIAQLAPMRRNVGPSLSACGEPQSSSGRDNHSASSCAARTSSSSP